MDNDAQELLFRELKDTISQLNATILELKAQLAAKDQELKAQLAAKDQELANKQEQIDYLANKVFGRSSEKHNSEFPGQLSLFDDLFNEAEAEADPSLKEPEAEEEVVVKSHTRKKRATQEELYGNLPTQKVVHELPEKEQYCETCGTKLKKIGEKFIRREFKIIPAKVEVIEHYSATYKCPECEKNNDTTYGDLPFITSAPVPAPLIPHSMASESMVAMVICQKFINGIPCYRQEPSWENLGVKLRRARMANWTIFCSLEYFLYEYEYFHRCLVKRKYLMADETRIQVLKEPGRAAETDSYMWLYRTGEDGLDPIMLYEYQETRKGRNAADFLEGFRGYLETDGYAGYNAVEGITRCCCWAHARRKFWEAIPSEMRNKHKEMDYSLPAVQGFQYIEKVFSIEKAINEDPDFSYEKRYELRLQREKPVLEAFWSWVEIQIPVKGSKFEKAINYVGNRKQELMNYLLDGHCSLHNNASERLAKSFVIGRKNWLFADTPDGARASAICYTMVEMAKANNLDPYRYLKYLLMQRPSREMSDEELSKFAPWNEDVRKALAN